MHCRHSRPAWAIEFRYVHRPTWTGHRRAIDVRDSPGRDNALRPWTSRYPNSSRFDLARDTPVTSRGPRTLLSPGFIDTHYVFL
ncbi:hypothetical protein EVAR_40552_1 [Eumeta japonica]|uniref:Uncharacterized protein n=1 Tax=Eumeta variegata TaxID=151549 RepID=A0A4C1VXN8_EUMVA|nr:hypothetical protein EVAR_40552_1 [Eumeta japonica]